MATKKYNKKPDMEKLIPHDRPGQNLNGGTPRRITVKRAAREFCMILKGIEKSLKRKFLDD